MCPGAMGEPDALEKRIRAGRGVRLPVQQTRKRDVLAYAQVRQKIEELKDDADFAAPVDGQLLFGQGADVAPSDGDGAGARAVDAADQVEKRRLSAAGRTHDGEKFSRRNLEIDSGQGDDRESSLVDFAQPAAQDAGRKGIPGCGHGHEDIG